MICLLKSVLLDIISLVEFFSYWTLSVGIGIIFSFSLSLQNRIIPTDYYPTRITHFSTTSRRSTRYNKEYTIQSFIKLTTSFSFFLSFSLIYILFHWIASFLLFSREVHCMEEALTVAAFSSVSHLFLEAPTNHEEKNEYEKTMGELVVCYP